MKDIDKDETITQLFDFNDKLIQHQHELRETLYKTEMLVEKLKTETLLWRIAFFLTIVFTLLSLLLFW